MRNDTPHAFVGATTFTVAGMTCQRCVRDVTDVISAVDGVETVNVDPDTGGVTVTATKPVDLTDIAQVIDEAGYHLVP